MREPEQEPARVQGRVPVPAQAREPAQVLEPGPVPAREQVRALDLPVHRQEQHTQAQR